MRYLSKTARTGLSIAAVALTAFATGAAAQQSTLDQVREQGFIRAAFADEIPYGFVNDEGKLTGISPEVARAVLKRIGVPQMDGVLTEFASLIPGLNANRWSIVAAGMFITPERCEQADFSIPTYVMGQSFLVPEGNPQDLHSYADVANNPDVTLAVLAGAVEVGYAEKAGIPSDRIKQFPDQASMLSAVRSGRADAAALTSPSIVRMARRGGEGVQAVKDFQTPPYATGYGGLVFRSSDDELRKAFNKELRNFVGSEEHLQLISQFGFTEANVPAKGVTTAELCQGEQGKELKDEE